MQKIAPFAALIVGLAGPAAAADVTGVWLSPSRSAHVQLAKCGEVICGKVLSATAPKSNPNYMDVHNKDPELRTRRIIGITILEGFRGGPAKWTGGKVYNPGDGNWYRSTITLVDDNHLTIRGCALMVICKSQDWTRVE